MSGFRAALEKHLQAIQDRDLDGLAATVAEQLVLVTSRGELHRSRRTFLELPADWVKVPGWSLGTELVWQGESADLATAVLALVYQEGAKTPERSYLTLGFARFPAEGGGERWLMVLDQNTPVRTAG